MIRMQNIIKRLFTIRHKIYNNYVKKQIGKVGVNFFVRKKFILRNGKYIQIGDNFLGMSGTRIEAWDKYEEESFSPEIVIGNNVSINMDCHIGAINKIVIGDNVLLGSRVFISDHSHGQCITNEIDIPPNHRKLFSKGPVIIEDNVWIGEGAAILSNVTVGYGSIIGANAVVTKNVPEKTVVGGCPARVIKKL